MIPSRLAANVIALLHLAHRFDVPRLLRECEKRLLNAREISLFRRLAACDRYGCEALQEHILSRMTRAECRRMVKDAVAEEGGALMMAALSPRLLVRLHKKYHGFDVSPLEMVVGVRPSTKQPAQTKRARKCSRSTTIGEFRCCWCVGGIRL